MKSSNFPGRKKAKRLKALENLHRHRVEWDEFGRKTKGLDIEVRSRKRELADIQIGRIDREIKTLIERTAA